LTNPMDNEKIQKIQELYKNDAVAQKFFCYAASRERSSETAVARVANHLQELESRIIKLFKTLGEIGLGRFIAGRHGKKTRMAWFFSLPSIGMAAKNQSKRLEQIKAEDESDSETQFEGGNPELIVHTYQIRRELMVKFGLPYDLNEKEAERLAIWIRTLPL
jgi:hypothetical protein